MSIAEYDTLDGLGLAALVRKRQVSPAELLNEAIARVERVNPRLNAVVTPLYEQARRTVAGPLPDGPFRGVPFLLKDLAVALAGARLTHGSRFVGDYTPANDSTLVARYRQAGLVFFGKTNTPEFGLLPCTEPDRFGPARNPWNPDFTPGGSSGGSAAAVAAGIVPVAHGNDGGGSIRIPAACCGLVGLKPARGRGSLGPDAGHGFLVTDGVLTRTVTDTAAALDVLAGYEPGDATWAAPPPAPYVQLMASEPARLRIGLVLNPPLDDAEVDPVNLAAARDAAALLESLGHHVEEFQAPWSDRGLLSDFTRAFGPATAMATFAGGRIAGREPTEDDVEPLTWKIWEHARAQNTISQLAAQGTLERIARTLVVELERFDVVVTPGLGMRPVRTGEIHGRGPDPWGHYRRSGAFTPYTAIVNVMGLPAIMLPLYQGADGLPTGVHFIGPPAREELLLAVAAQLERTLPWAERLPALPPSPVE
jgi:amidase